MTNHDADRAAATTERDAPRMAPKPLPTGYYLWRLDAVVYCECGRELRFNAPKVRGKCQTVCGCGRLYRFGLALYEVEE